MALVSIITVNYHQPQVTLELLKSIKRFYAQANIEIILVDNGCDYNNAEFYREEWNELQYIQSLKNVGFAGANNLGIQRAKGEFLFLVNNDTEFTENLIEELVETMNENPTIGIISPKINYFDDKHVIQYAGFTPMNFFTCRNKCIGQHERDSSQYADIKHQTGYVHGAAMMTRTEVIQRAGLMSENFFLYFEEMDWCEQIKQAGYEVWVNTNALIFHKESISVGKNSALKEYFMNRNRILFIRRNATTIVRLLFYAYFALVVTPRNVIRYIKEGRTDFILVLFSAIKWNIFNRITSIKLGYPIK